MTEHDVRREGRSTRRPEKRRTDWREVLDGVEGRVRRLGDKVLPPVRSRMARPYSTGETVRR